MEIWAFLTSVENRETLTWIGGGLAAVFGGLWAFLRFVLSRKSGGEPTPEPAKAPRSGSTRIEANNQGIAGGGDVRVTQGMRSGHIVLLVLALAGVGLIAISQFEGTSVTATGGSSVVGGDVTGSTINVGN